MKLFRLLLVALLFSCSDDSKETQETGEPKPIVVEMEKTNVPNNLTDVTGTYILENNREYGVREDGKYKILLTKSKYKDKDQKEKEVLTYTIFDVAKNKPLYFTVEIDVAKRLERNWEYYDTYNPEITDKKLVCKSRIKEENK
ncbi:hypothetical protein [Bacteroides sp. GM023]|uniref:hypothetical protein n=1 Tax=Bacteroides sp. GM023 TaxID=2723058 RepID=UPI00168A64AA|nr:hypothetical protein [Bacteroides sp. GM023]MBD3592550.1 hypothetical protein [Bacteroides sp. GM023]